MGGRGGDAAVQEVLGWELVQVAQLATYKLHKLDIWDLSYEYLRTVCT